MQNQATQGVRRIVRPGEMRPAPSIVEHRNFWQERGLDIVTWLAPTIGRSAVFRKPIVRRFERELSAANRIAAGTRAPAVERDRADMGLAILHTAERLLAEGRIARPVINRLMTVLVKEGMIRKGDAAARERFASTYGMNPPSFLVISPGKGCNLSCTGCYASSDAASRSKLSWEVFDRLVTEQRELWGGHFVVISGGEPLVYRDQGKGLLDMAAKHPDMFFMFYTNGTLIDEPTAQRIAELGNVMPAISVEGLREKTDARRGPGVFDQVVAAMDRLREAKALFGMSMTATRENYQELLADETVDFFFNQHGVSFAWLFHYMPIGRAYTLDLMPTVEQRKWLWEQAWRQIRTRQIMIADFWNSGTVVDGCLSGGRSGGYLYVDWEGHVSPCVFVPYSPVNINDVYANGQTLNDAWSAPFFSAIRDWQRGTCGFRDGGSKTCANLLTPCFIRDHHEDFMRLAQLHRPEPIDEAAAQALEDADYHRGLEAFDQELQQTMEPIWQKQYVESTVGAVEGQ
ncbi:MAG: radical SAM protein [Anaerolineales bacterium]